MHAITEKAHEKVRLHVGVLRQRFPLAFLFFWKEFVSFVFALRTN